MQLMQFVMVKEIACCIVALVNTYLISTKCLLH